jgi:hypothetical protein
MEGNYALPGWTRRHFGLVLLVIVALAIVLRLPSEDQSERSSAVVASHHPVAAAIGLTSDVPPNATVATWINAGVYSIGLKALTLTHPEASPADFRAAFMNDPDGFSALAHFAILLATAATICLTYLLVSRLIDPAAGIVAAFILAAHPYAVNFASDLHSGVFCLLFVLGGLLIATGIDWARARATEFAAVGLSFGFALDTMPVAAVLFLAVVIVSIRMTPRKHYRRLAIHLALASIVFTLAAATVLPATAPFAETLHVIGFSALLIGALVLVARALHSLRDRLQPATYSTVVLSTGILVAGLAAFYTPAPVRSGTEAACSHASNWIVQNAPADTAIGVHPTLSASLSLPRSARSWRREAHIAADPVHAEAAARAAERLAGPTFDVIISQPQHLGEAQYIVLPDTIQPAATDQQAGYWLVAHFRSHSPDQPGIIIWGTPTAPHATPAHVNGTCNRSRRYAGLSALH